MMPIASKLFLPLALSLTLSAPAFASSGDCPATSARDNRASPLRTGVDFIPLAHDDSLGFYEVYSLRKNPSNNVGIFIFELDGGEILIFGAGYGNHEVAVNDARYDVSRVDAVLRNCLGRDPSSTPIRFISPHWHGDHINVEFIHELEALGYPVVEILFHEDDAPYIYGNYNWTNADKSKFTLISHAGCFEEIVGFSSPLGKIWFTARKGHAPGAIDAVIDVRGNVRDRFMVLGSAPGGACTGSPSGTRNVLKAHGNALLRTDPQVVPYGCGMNTDGRLEVLSGKPLVGSAMMVGVDNPTGILQSGAIPYLWASGAPDALVPCGTVIDMDGLARPEEVLLGELNGAYQAPPSIGLPWTGPGSPSTFEIDIPYDQALVGCSFFYQGALLDPFGGTGARIVLTEALELRIGK